MDTQKKNDWRLERLIAVLLSLLYLLPFVARAGAYPPDGAGLHLLEVDAGEWQPAVAVSSEWNIEVDGSVARAHLLQTFRNETQSSVEGVYVLPLPPNAVVERLSLRIGERVTDAPLPERHDEHATRRGEVAPETHRISLASMLPGEEATVEASWTQPVQINAGGGSLRVPVLAAPHDDPWDDEGPSRPEHARLPNMLITHAGHAAATVNVIVRAGLPVSSIESPSHPRMNVESLGRDAWRISIDPSRPGGELDLRWRTNAGS